MNRIDKLFAEKKNNILSVYFTAGHPDLNSTVEVIQELEKNGVDMIEIGMPFSDPLADGPVIQKSSLVALKNGMSINLLFEQLAEIRKTVNIPLLLMGYLNPVYQYGIEKFLEKAASIGIDGVIIPDLPVYEYAETFKPVFEKNNIHNIFLVTPETTDERLKKLDSQSSGFIYMVSSSATTGAKSTIKQNQEEYFQRVKDLALKNPKIVGFGISNKETFEKVCDYANGAIIGSAFVKVLEDDSMPLKERISEYIKSILQ